MKKFLSISFVILIFLSGTHLSVATHICGGKVAAVKWSFSEKKADCGMEDSSGTCSVPSGISSNCCQNKVAVYAVDNSYCPTFFHLDLGKQQLQTATIPAAFPNHSLAFFTLQSTDSKPPEKFIPSMVSLPYICVFRI
jgi:hypothetical protein